MMATGVAPIAGAGRLPRSRDRDQQDRPHAVVIGSGFGGLAAAIRLGVRGYRVTILERLDQPGGRARVHRQDGFTFDAGPTVITAPFLLEELWQLCGRRMEDEIDLRPVAPFYRIRFDDGETFEYTGSAEAMRREVARFAPEDVPGYEALVEASERIFGIGFEQLAHVPFGRLGDMARIVPQMVQLESYRSVLGYVSQFVKNERLRTVFSFHPLLVGGNPLTTTSIYILIAFLERKWGVRFPIGRDGSPGAGPGPAGRIGGRAGSVRGERSIAFSARTAAPPACAWKTGRRSTPISWCPTPTRRGPISACCGMPRIAPAGPTGGSRARDTPWDCSCGISAPTASTPTCPTTRFSWARGTGASCRTSSTVGASPTTSVSICTAPPRRTRHLAPPGCDGFYVLSPVPNLLGATDWRTEAEAYRQKIADYLDATVLPGLNTHLVTSRVTTPQTFRDELLSVHGAGFSLEPVLTQSAWFRPHNESEEIEGLYLVGAGTHPGAGVPGVLSSARVLDSVVPDPSVLVRNRHGSR